MKREPLKGTLSLLFWFCFPNRLDRRIYETKFPKHVSFVFPLSICCITVAFPSTLKTILLFMALSLLLCYQSRVNRSSRKIEGNFTHKVNYR